MDKENYNFVIFLKYLTKRQYFTKYQNLKRYMSIGRSKFSPIGFVTLTVFKKIAKPEYDLYITTHLLF